jgi:hypothetical protein
MRFATDNVPIKLKSTAAQLDEEIRPTLQTLVQLYNNGEKKKGEVPIFNGGDAEDMIYTIYASSIFHRTKQKVCKLQEVST